MDTPQFLRDTALGKELYLQLAILGEYKQNNFIINVLIFVIRSQWHFFLYSNTLHFHQTIARHFIYT